MYSTFPRTGDLRAGFGTKKDKAAHLSPLRGDGDCFVSISQKAFGPFLFGFWIYYSIFRFASQGEAWTNFRQKRGRRKEEG